MATPKELGLQVNELVRLTASKLETNLDVPTMGLDALMTFYLDGITLHTRDGAVAKCVEVLNTKTPVLYILKEVDADGALLPTPITLFENSDVIAGRVIEG
jgi:hypothetical protein